MIKKIKGAVFCAKKAHLAGYLMMKGFTLKRMPVDENNPNYNVFIFNNTPGLELVVNEYFKEYGNN